VAPAPPAERRSAISESNLQRSGGYIEHGSANDRRAMHLETQRATTPIRRIVFGRPQEEEFQAALHIHPHHEQGVNTQ